MRRDACRVLESFSEAVMVEICGWLAGDRSSQGAYGRVLYGLLVSLGSTNSIANNPLPPVIVAPPLSPQQIKKQFGAQKALNVQFPLSFIKHCSSSTSDVVADFMCGSGSCAVAAAFCGRSSVSVDINPKMVCSFRRALRRLRLHLHTA